MYQEGISRNLRSQLGALMKMAIFIGSHLQVVGRLPIGPMLPSDLN